MSADMLGVCHLNTILYNAEAVSLGEFSTMLRLNTGLELSASTISECATRAIALQRTIPRS
jgi:aldehyde:ferredoxin oxidoreductase